MTAAFHGVRERNATVGAAGIDDGREEGGE